MSTPYPRHATIQYVFAQNFTEFRNFCSFNGWSTHDPDVVFVATAETFQAVATPPDPTLYQVHVLPGFEDRSDAREILAAAQSCGLSTGHLHPTQNS